MFCLNDLVSQDLLKLVRPKLDLLIRNSVDKKGTNMKSL